MPIKSKLQYVAGCFKASKTLSGIETRISTNLNLSQYLASKPLKPFQGLKQIFSPLFLVLAIAASFKASKTLSGIETPQQSIRKPATLLAK